VRHAIAVNNGTTALVAALQVAGPEPGDEGGHEPVHVRRDRQRDPRGGRDRRFADIREDDFNVDPDAMEAAIGDGPRR
jgi:dTDP-4-amino-4,6-dideoxygalactose transaminase